jgi:hypothetical protein
MRTMTKGARHELELLMEPIGDFAERNRLRITIEMEICDLMTGNEKEHFTATAPPEEPGQTMFSKDRPEDCEPDPESILTLRRTGEG